MRKDVNCQGGKKVEDLNQDVRRWGIPNSWRWKTIADVGSVITGNTPSTRDRANYGSDIPFVKPPELLDKGIWEAPEGLSIKGMQSARLIKPGAVLVSCIGGLGKTGIAKVLIAFNQQINAIIFSESVIPEYGFYYAQTLKDWLYSVASATTLPIVNKGRFQKAPIPIAPLNEQKRIVAEIEKQFSRLDDAVTGLKRAKTNLKRYKAAVLKAAVEGKLTEQWRKEHPDVEPASKLLERILAERRKKFEQADFARMPPKEKKPKDNKAKIKYREPVPPDYTTLSALPKGWCWSSTDQLFWFVTSGSRGWAKYYSNSGAIFLRVGNVDHDTIALDLKDIQRVDPPENAEGTRTRVETNDILISITADVGMVAVVPYEFEEAYINQHISLARPVSVIESPYLGWYLAARPGQMQFRELQRGATKAGLGLDDIRSINIPLPPLEEQKEIVSQIERRLSIVHELNQDLDVNLRRAERLRQSILKKAFSGRLVLQIKRHSPN